MVSNTIDLRLNKSPIGFLGFCNRTTANTNVWWCSSAWLNIAATDVPGLQHTWLTRQAVGHIYSQVKALLSFFTSFASVWGSPLNAGSPNATVSQSCWPRCSVTLCLLLLYLLQHDHVHCVPLPASMVNDREGKRHKTSWLHCVVSLLLLCAHLILLIH